MMRSRRFSGPFFFAAAIALLAIWGLAETVGWPIKSALYPRAVGVPLFLLAVFEVALTLRPKEQTAPGRTTDVSLPPGGTMDVSLSTEVPPDVAARRTAVMVAWLGGFCLAIILIGFPRSVPLFLFAYLRGQAREAWMSSVVLAAIGWLGFYLLFVKLLHVPFADGLLWGFLVR
jgi:hypothetical protein